jgi:glutathione synthase/RimK-type ligase-like ATP-grasp enzyme
MTPLPRPYPLPLAASAVAAAYLELPKRFEARHPGYRRFRPAFLPMVMPGETAQALWDATASCLAALTSRALLPPPGATRQLLADLGYPADEVQWLTAMASPRNLRLASLFARADFVLGKAGPRLIELNVSPTAGGIGLIDRYADEAGALVREHAAQVVARFPRPAQAWARVLRMVAADRVRSRSGRVRVALAITDEDIDVPIPYEAAHFLRAEGIDAEVIPAGKVCFDGPQASTGNGPVDVVYGCFTYEEAATPAYRSFVDRAMSCESAGGPVYVAPPVFTMLGNKAMLAQRHDPALWPYLAPTWVADEAALRAARSCRADLVLKPAIGYGGKGVVIGRECTDEQWADVLSAAAADPRRHVFQDYVEPATIELPGPDGPAGYEMGIGCVLVDGQLAGFLLRFVAAGTAAVINVSRGAVFSAACLPPSAADLLDDEPGTGTASEGRTGRGR